MEDLNQQNKELRAICAGMAERLEALSRENSALRNEALRDDTHIIAMARRAVLTEVTPELVEAWYRGTDHQLDLTLHPEHDENWEGLWPWHRQLIVEAAMHFGNRR